MYAFTSESPLHVKTSTHEINECICFGHSHESEQLITLMTCQRQEIQCTLAVHHHRSFMSKT